MAIYGEYARVYDASGQIAFSEQIIPYLRRLLSRHPVPVGRMLDLACGTGTTAIAMALQGWHVTGLDGSKGMLAEAKSKAAAVAEPGLTDRLVWQQGDMRRFRLAQPVDLVTCLYDSLNYMLTSDDLLAAAKHVFAALRPGGVFFFDMNTAYALETFWEGQTYVTDSPELTVIMASRHDYEEHRSTVTVTCFERQGNCHRRFDETHVEQAYPREHVSTLLTDAGFRVEGCYECFTLSEPEDDARRLMWAARRPGAPSSAEAAR